MKQELGPSVLIPAFFMPVEKRPLLASVPMVVEKPQFYLSIFCVFLLFSKQLQTNPFEKKNLSARFRIPVVSYFFVSGSSGTNLLYR
tara:strand:+ start:12800 stop:13060 length:261 start_codon:yes stop_codon:yes gene_type:complete